MSSRNVLATYEATHILDALLQNLSNLQRGRLHADTHGQPAAVFGLAYPLGIELMPLVDDNYVGRLEAYTGRVREAGLPLDFRTQIEARRHARQENHGPPSALVQATPQQAQSSSFCRQSRSQRAKRPASTR